jgi:hypothetical protein
MSIALRFIAMSLRVVYLATPVSKEIESDRAHKYSHREDCGECAVGEDC